MDIMKLLLDIALIGLLGVGVYYALRLEKQLRILRASHKEMAVYTADFARTVDRAEASIKTLKLTAREAGDDLERQIERAKSLQEELHYVVAHADKLAERIAHMADNSAIATPPSKIFSAGETSAQSAAPPPLVPVRHVGSDKTKNETKSAPPETRSRAERELLAALNSLQEQQA